MRRKNRKTFEQLLIQNRLEIISSTNELEKIERKIEEKHGKRWSYTVELPIFDWKSTSLIRLKNVLFFLLYQKAVKTRAFCIHKNI